MSSPLEELVLALAARLGPRVRERIERVDEGQDGELFAWIPDGAGRGWYRFAATAERDARELEPAPPERDERVPLAAALRGERARVLAYRPRRRLVLSRAEPGRAALVLKGLRPRRSAEAALRHAAAERAAAGSGLVVPKLLEHREEDAVLVFEHLPGARLALSERDADALFRTGAGLRRFQASATDVPVHAAADELAVLDRWLALHERVAGPPPFGAHSLREGLAHAATSLPEVELAPAHRDLHDGQLLATGEQIGAIDFDLFARADPALDAANLLAHLALRALQRAGGATRYSVKVLGDALLDGLDRGEEPSFWGRLRFYQATSLLRLALVHGLRPRWNRLAPDLVELAELCLNGTRIR